MAVAGTAFVNFQGDYSGLLASSKVAGAKAGGIAGAGFAKSLAKGLVVGAAAAAAVAAGLYKVGEAFDAEYDKIRVGTGATGDALQALKGDFKDVATSVPTSLADAGTAVADLNTRLSLTGKPLQDLSEQFINLSRITGTDLSTNIDNLTRMFGDAGIAPDDYAESLDKVYLASQASGIGLDELSVSATQFGAPLRNLGFDFDTSLALLSQFNKTGVNTSTVFAGLKAGVGKLAKAGEPVPETFARVVDEITKMGPGTEATAKAIDLFGQRAGPDLADAIAGGKFEVDEMLAAITGGSDTINGAAEDTASFAEKWQMFKNKVLVKLEPIAIRVFEFLGDAMDSLPGLVSNVTDAFNESDLPGILSSVADTAQDLWDGFMDALPTITDLLGDLWDGAKDVANGFEDLLDEVEPVFDAIAGFVKKNPVPVFAGLGAVVLAVVVPAFISWAASAWAAASAMIVLYAPIVAIVAGIGLLVGAVVYAYQNFDSFRNVVDAAWQGIQTAAHFAWNNVLKPIFTAVKFYITDILIPVFKGYLAVAQFVFSMIWAAVQDAWEIIKPIFSSIVAFVGDTLIPKFQTISSTVSTVFGAVWSSIDSAWTTIKPVFDTIVTFIGETLAPVWEKVSSAVSSAFGAIPDTIGAALRLAGNLVAGFMRGAAGIADAIGLDSVAEALRSGADKADGWGEGPSKPRSKDYVRGYAAGGFISGGTPGKDSVPAMLMPGEVVIRKSMVDKYGASNLLALNAGRAIGFAGGGQVPKSGQFIDESGNVVHESKMADPLLDYGSIIDAARSVLAGAVEKIWPKLDVTNSISGIPAGGFNNFRQSAIDFIRGKAEKIVAADAAEHSTSASGLAGSATGINADFLERFNQYSAAVGGLSIVSGFRSTAKQAELYQKYLNGTGNLAARPGTSNHERGLAIDHAPRATAAMKATARSFRLHYPVGGEPWHVEPFAKGGQVPVAQHRQSFDSGGVLRPGWNMVRNDTGAPEDVRPGRGDAPLIGEAHFHDGVDIDLVAQKLGHRVMAGAL